MKKTIRLGSFLLAFLLLVCTLPVTAWAASTSCATVDTELAMALATAAAPSGLAPVTDSEMTRVVVSLVTLTL